MAIKPVSNIFTIDSNDTYVIGNAAQAFVGTYAIHFVDSGTFDGSITVGIRAIPIGGSAASPAFLPIPYLPLNTAGTVVAGATYATAAIGDTGYILVPATGGIIALTCASRTTGSMACYVQPVAGAAA